MLKCIHDHTGKFKSSDLRFDAGGVRIPGGHGMVVVCAGEASCLIIISLSSISWRRRTALS